MKKSFTIAIIGLTFSIITSSCKHGIGTKSPTDSLNADSAKRDVIQADTEKKDTNHVQGGDMQGDGHPRGGLY